MHASRLIVGLLRDDFFTELDADGSLPALARGQMCSPRNDGLIFLAGCMCDLRLESVEWTRSRITEHGVAPVCDRGGG